MWWKCWGRREKEYLLNEYMCIADLHLLVYLFGRSMVYFCYPIFLYSFFPSYPLSSLSFISLFHLSFSLSLSPLIFCLEGMKSKQ